MKSRNNIAIFRIHGAARDFLNKNIISEPIRYLFDNNPSVKDAIESLGPPHTEISSIIVNSKLEQFDYLLKNHDDINVYSFDQIPHISEDKLFPNKPQGEPKFILDVHLGALARYLRFTGLDTMYDVLDPGDKVLAEISFRESRILVTRDIGLLKHSRVEYGCWLRSDQPKQQFLELARRYELIKFLKLFSRCSLCNGLISEVKKELIEGKISNSIYTQFKEFWQCSSCGQIYWKGKHYYRIKKSVKTLIKHVQTPEYT